MLSLGIGDIVTSRLGRVTVVTLLAIVYGVGHIYAGQVRRGIAVLIIGFGLSLISYPGYTSIQHLSGTDLQALSINMIVNLSLIAVGLGSFVFWVWQIFDARKVAKQQAIEA
ncbi:MAG TPA: hypothetical protein VD736_01955 [Nitrososphaera sp.]|nr:hypothetical protein [Nitrososphaera sp.]